MNKRVDPIAFSHPAAFWGGCAAVAIGVSLQIPTYVMAAPEHYRLNGMAMNFSMLLGMGLIGAGVLLAAYGLLPRDGATRITSPIKDHVSLHIADNVPLNREHLKLVIVLALALTIDVMKPASVAFVMPGMAHEYGISMTLVGYLAVSALTGTVFGSVMWGYLADSFGRRPSILLASILFMGTAVCGTMPSFTWNLAMCFVMGAAAGGMLPITFALMAETIPTRHRGWLLVAVGGTGATAGFFAASAAAALLEPTFSWRVLWLLNLPTGALMVVLNRFIPESPRFLARMGMLEQARAVLMRFSHGTTDSSRFKPPDSVVVPFIPKPTRNGLGGMLHSRRARVTLTLMACGVAWGVVNFGFILWLPIDLRRLNLDAEAVRVLMARSAVLAIPGVAVTVWLYQRWSSFKLLVSCLCLTVLALSVFAAIRVGVVHTQAIVVVATVLLLIAVSGVISTLMPYAAEVSLPRLRGTGSGLVASASKAGGILGTALGVFGLFNSFLLSAVVLGVPMVVIGIVMWHSGVETSRQGLESIQQQFE